MENIETLDRSFNLDRSKVQLVDEEQMFAKFQDELNAIAETQRLSGTAPDRPIIDNINQTDTKKKVMMSTVATMLTQQFGRSKLPMSQLDAFMEFAKQKVKGPTHSLTGSLTYKQ